MKIQGTLAALLVMSLVIFSSCGNAAETENRHSVWETLCLKESIVAACDRAVVNLTDRFIDADDGREESALKERLVRVSSKGCAMGHASLCTELQWIEEESLTLPAIANLSKR